MDSDGIIRFVHQEQPFLANRRAEQRLLSRLRDDPDLLPHFAARNVLALEGGFPCNEGYLYDSQAALKKRCAAWPRGDGKPMQVGFAGHQGTSAVQQDAFDAALWRLGRRRVAAIVVADGVSSSGPRATRASHVGVQTFMQVLQQSLQAVNGERCNHAFVEAALRRAVFVANFEILRQALFDFNGNDTYDEDDRQILRDELQVDLPSTPLNDVCWSSLHATAEHLNHAIATLHASGLSALTTLVAAVAVDSHVYTFNAGDSVVGLCRPQNGGSPAGYIHLTARDQLVVDLFLRNNDLYKKHPEIHENIITLSLGDALYPQGTIRVYPFLLEHGDTLVASTDGIGPRSSSRGVSGKDMEAIVAQTAPVDLPQALVKGQLAGLEDGEYQDNIGVAVLSTQSPS